MLLVYLPSFGYSITISAVSLGDKVHSLTNVMTMSKEVHEYFDRLSLYFEAVVSLKLLLLVGLSIHVSIAWKGKLLSGQTLPALDVLCRAPICPIFNQRSQKSPRPLF